MKHHRLKVILIVAGAVCEMLGLLWLAANTSRERIALGEGGPFHKFWRWLAYWLGPVPEPVELHLAVAGGVSATGSLAIATLNETELQRVQRELNELRERLERLEAATHTRLSAVEQSLNEMAQQVAGPDRGGRGRGTGTRDAPTCATTNGQDDCSCWVPR
jgi:hypothetical protein